LFGITFLSLVPDLSLNAGIVRSLLKRYGKEIALKNPGSAPMTECVSAIQGKKGTAIEIGTGLGTGIGTEEGTVRKTKGVTVIVVIEIGIGTGTGTGTVVGIMIERRSVVVLMTVNVREAGIVREITSMQITNVNALACMRGMMIMPMVS
jgi:hypothetical protein